MLVAFSSLSALHAQNAPPDIAKLFTSDVMRQSMKNQMKASYRSMWNGSGTNMMLYGVAQNPDFQEALGVTEEQSEQLKKLGQAFQSNPEALAAMQELQKFQNPADPFFEKATNDVKEGFLAAQAKFGQLMIADISKGMEQVFTPEQKRMTQEILIASMGTLPIPNPEMFEALDLTDEQREQMEAIKKELELEFEQVADELVDGMYASFDLLLEEAKKDGVKMTTMDELEKAMEKTAEKLKARGIDYKASGKAKLAGAQDFVKTFKFKMYDVLTDAQMKKMWDLINKPPKYMEKILAKLKKNYEERSQSTGWQPGPQSWQPGDPIPAEYIEHRKAKFPKKK